MILWEGFVRFLIVVLFMLAQIFGGNLGLAIITLSVAVRLALLPLTVRVALHAQSQRAKLQALQPEIRELTVKYESDPQRLSAEMWKLYKRHGYTPFGKWNIIGGLAQLPIGVGLYSAISRGLGVGGRFLWISDLARRDAVLALLIGALTLLASILSPELPRQSRIIITLFPALITAYIAWSLASGIGLYWASSAAVGVLQVGLVRRNSK